MKRIFTILVTTISTALLSLSCSEHKAGTTKNVTVEVKNEDKADTKNAKLETSDTVVSKIYPDKRNPSTYTKDLDLFLMLDLEGNANKKVGIVSLSDKYPLSEHPDSSAIPSLENVDSHGLLYFALDSIYRKRFLSKNNISELDSLFIYDYSTDTLCSFPVNKLRVVAYLNIYMSPEDCPCNQKDYMIGFEVAKTSLNGLGKYFSNALVIIGKENPFVQGRMKRVQWKKIESKNFPTMPINAADASMIRNYQSIAGSHYFYKHDNLLYYLQEFVKGGGVDAMRLLVLNAKTKEFICERIYFDSEGGYLASITSQWTGKLFKNKPPVIFGFEHFSFGCSGIVVLKSKENDMVINCDNRH